MGHIANQVLFLGTHIISLQERIIRLQVMRDELFRSLVLKAYLDHCVEGTRLSTCISIAFNEAINELAKEQEQKAWELAKIGEGVTNV